MSPPKLSRLRMGVLLIGLGYLATAIALDRYGTRGIDQDARYDAIVVAGCRVMPDGRPSPALRRRVELAVRMWHQGIAPTIVFTGGVGDSPPSEASTAGALAAELDVPRSAILLEERSTSTDENARFAAELLPDQARIVVVSDTYHVFRCERVFRRYFGEVRGRGSEGQHWPRMKGSLREVLAVTAYGVLGRLSS